MTHELIEKEFEIVLKYLSNKQWLLKPNFQDTINKLKQQSKESKDMDLKRAVKNYTKYFKEPLYFEHDTKTYKTSRVFAQYVLFPNKSINGVQLKSLIIPESNYYFVSFDFKTSQIRHMAYIRNIKKIKDMINNDIDIYEEFAKKLEIDRKSAKLAILLLSYGGSSSTLENELNTGKYREIEDLFNDWFQTESMTYEDKVKLNHVIQKTEANYLKRKMIKLLNSQNDKWRLHAFIHDEIILEIHENHLDEIDKIKNYLEKYKKIKMKVEVRISKSFQFE